MSKQTLMRKIMKERRWTLEYVAEIIGVTYSAVGYWARGKRLPRNKGKRRALKALFNVLDVDDLFEIGEQ